MSGMYRTGGTVARGLCCEPDRSRFEAYEHSSEVTALADVEVTGCEVQNGGGVAAERGEHRDRKPELRHKRRCFDAPPETFPTTK
jgi:hypothetical protein